MWTRQVARAAGASLIAPLVLLLAAGAVASGGGLGGIGSLSQIASGPSLPDTGLVTASDSSFESAEIVGAELPSPAVPVTTGPAPGGGELAAASPTSPGAPPTVGRGPSTRTIPPPSREFESKPPTPLTDTGGTPRLPAAGEPAPGPNPIDDIEDTTRDLGGSLPEPLRPIANQLIELLLGPPRP